MKIVVPATPAPASVLDHATRKGSAGESGGSAATALAGGVSSSALQIGAVSIGAFRSNTIEASLQTVSPSASAAFGATVNETLPSPSGGVTFGARKPATGSSVSSSVSGSRERKRHVAMPVSRSSAASTPTIRFSSGRRSQPPLHDCTPGAGVSVTSAKVIGPSANVSRSRRSASSASVTTTS